MGLFLVCCVIFLGISGLLPQLDGFPIPLPLWVGTGIALAIASNADKQAGLPWRSPSTLPANPSTLPVTPSTLPVTPSTLPVTPSTLPDNKDVPPPASQPVTPPVPPAAPSSPQLPTITSLSPEKSISFTIHKAPPHRNR